MQSAKPSVISDFLFSGWPGRCGFAEAPDDDKQTRAQSFKVSTYLFSLLMLAFAIDAQAAEPVDVVFKSTLDGTEQRYVQILPDGFDPDEPHGLLIALHGHGSDRWQFINDGRGECAAARDAAAKHKLIYVSPDYRAKTSWMGPAAEADVVQILKELRAKYCINKVILSGGSMGGTAALTFAAVHPELVDGVVSMNGTANLVEYDQFQDAISASFGGSKLDVPEEYRKRSAELHADRLTMPIALTTGGQDRLVPPDSVQRLASALEQSQRKVLLIHRQDGGHSTDYVDATAAFEFILTELAKPPAKPLLEFGPKPVTIVCLGDSVTGVYYHTGGRRAYPEMLQIAIIQALPAAQVRVINAGISGNTTADGLARLERDVLSHKPNLVTISFGLNDMARLSETQFEENLTSLVEKCRAANAQVVLCTPNAVMETGHRPIAKLIQYCDRIRSLGKKLQVPVCDQYAAGERLRARDALAWRLTLSDEIHPNIDGHKRMAEELCRTIASRHVSLKNVDPPRDALQKTNELLRQGKPVRVLAMPPYDIMIAPALKQLHPAAEVEVTPWPVEGKSLTEIEQAANKTVRAMKPDLAILAVPAKAAENLNDEQFIRAYSWIMNWSLSFGHQEWDCLVVHPSVLTTESKELRADLIRQLVRAQDLTLVDRKANDLSTAETIFLDSLKAFK